MERWKRVVGVILGIGFMILGILQFFYPELAGATRPDSRIFASYASLILFFAGLAEVLYIVFSERG